MTSLASVLMSCLTVGASAQDRCEERDEECVVVETPEEYEALLAELDDGGGPESLQLFEGTTGVLAPLGDRDFVDAGVVVTEEQSETHFVERWILYRPEETLRLPQRLRYEGGVVGGFQAVLAEYESRPDADQYGWLELDLEYRLPPSDEAIQKQADVVPSWVEEVLGFEVWTDRGGVLEESGALYRERGVVDGDELWRDVWVLWDNYEFPNAANGAVTELTVVSSPPQTVKAFLQQQQTMPQWLFVQASSRITPVQ